MPPAARTRTPSADIAALLTDTAAQMIEEFGADKLTVRAVAAAAGVSPMGVYNHFGDKEGLLDSVIARGFSQLRDAVASTDPDPQVRLRRSGEGYRAFAIANPRVYAIMFGPAQSRSLARARSEAPGICAFAALVEVVTFGQAGGALAAGDPREIALQIWSAVHGAISLELDGLVPIIEPGRAYQAVIAMISRGLRPD